MLPKKKVLHTSISLLYNSVYNSFSTNHILKFLSITNWKTKRILSLCTRVCRQNTNFTTGAYIFLKAKPWCSMINQTTNIIQLKKKKFNEPIYSAKIFVNHQSAMLNKHLQKIINTYNQGRASLSHPERIAYYVI